MEQVFLSLGSNLGDRVENLRQAIARLREFATVRAVSHAYESEPVEFTEQPWYVNAAVCLLMKEEESAAQADSPQQLLRRLQAIEFALGRRRDENTIPKGPRLIDLDIVLYGSRVIHTTSLNVPHPAMHLRRFVLQPLAEIASDVEHPLLHQTVKHMLNALPTEGSTVRILAPFATDD